MKLQPDAGWGGYSSVSTPGHVLQAHVDTVKFVQAMNIFSIKTNYLIII